MAATEASVNIHHHGMALDEQKKRVQCNYCGKVMSGFSRLKYHLGGVRGDVVPCEEVPENVKDLMRNELLEKKRGYLSKEVGELYHPDLPWKRNWCPNSNGVKHKKLETAHTAGSGSGKRVDMDSISEDGITECVSFPNGRICSQTAVNSEAEKDSSSREAQKSIGRFFYETGIDFTVANSPSFQRMINATLGCDQIGYKIPSCQELKGWILQDEVKEMQQYVKEIRNSWASTGCSILLDGWVDEKGRNLINFLVDCPRGPIYLRSSDISASVGDVDALQLLFDGVIEEVGVDNVIQIIAYSTLGCMEAVGKHLMEKNRTVFWTVSASHCVELMLEKIGMMDPIKGILDKAKTITKFIHSHATVLELMRNHTYLHDLVKPSKIRSAIPFLILENIVSEKENSMNMFLSPEWNTSIWASRREGKRIADLMLDPSFWTGASMVLKATIPLVRVLCLINGANKPQMGYIYETMDQAKETIKKEFKNKRAQYMPFWEVIDGIWDNYLHSPLHAAGYFLNPSLFYSSDFFTDAEVASGLLCCIVRMVQDRHVQDLISLQVDEYREAKGAFKQGSAIDRRTNIPPALWWSYYGGQCPELQRFAIRILSQTCNGASRYRLKRSLTEKLLSNGRNRIEQHRLSDLAFVHYNLQLRHFEPGTNNDIMVGEIDPTDDWIVDEAQEVVSQNGNSAWMDSDCGDTTITKGAINVEGPSSFQPKEEPR